MRAVGAKISLRGDVGAGAAIGVSSTDIRHSVRGPYLLHSCGKSGRRHDGGRFCPICVKENCACHHHECGRFTRNHTLFAHPISHSSAAGLSQVHRKAFEVRERAVMQSPFMGGAQHHARRVARRKRFLPAWRTETPAIPWFEAGETEFRDRG